MERGSFLKLHRIHGFQQVREIILIGLLMGILSGIAAAVFFHLINLCTQIFLIKLAHFAPPYPAGEKGPSLGKGESIIWYILPFIPALGGLICGILIHFFEGGSSKGEEDEVVCPTDHMLVAFHERKGVIKGVVPFVRTVASSVVIGSGGSAGREGPIAQIGAGIGSIVGGLLGLNERERRKALLAGVAGGIGAIFRAPLGGAILAVEILYTGPEFEFEALIPCIISSIIAYSVFGIFFGWEPLFNIPQGVFSDPMELIFYSVLGVILALVGIVFVKVFYGIEKTLFKRIKIRKFLKPALGGFLLGIMALFLPGVLGPGYGWIQLALDGKLSMVMMIILGFAKIIATSLTITSGGSGGIFAPSIYIGAMIGGAFGYLASHIAPGLIKYPATFIVVGMGGFFAGVGKVPVSSLIMVSEMTGGYGLLVPMMLVSSIAYLLTGRYSIFEKQYPGRMDSPAHFGDFAIDILEKIPVKNAIKKKDIVVLPENIQLKEILERLADSHQYTFPISNRDGRISGMITLETLRRIIREESLYDLILAKDLASDEVFYLREDSNLKDAAAIFSETELVEIPVMGGSGDNEIVGMLSRKDILIAYNQFLKGSGAS